MQLADELFTDIITALGKSRAEAKGFVGEKRKSDRVGVDTDVLMAPCGVCHARPRTVRLLNISAKGVAIRDWQAMQIGEKFLVHLPRTSAEPVPVVCIVKCSRLIAGQAQFRIGAEFTSHAEKNATQRPLVFAAKGMLATPADSGITAALEKIRKQDYPDGKRRHRRVDVQARSSIRIQKEKEQGPITFVEIHDISKSGICVVHSEPLERNQTFMISLPIKNAKPMVLSCTVIDCLRMPNGQFRIGAAFKAGPLKLGGFGAMLRRWFAA